MIMVKYKCTRQKIINVQHEQKFIKTRCIVQYITCYTVSRKYIEFLLRYFLALKKIKFTGYIINNVSDDLIGAKRREASSKR